MPRSPIAAPRRLRARPTAAVACALAVAALATASCTEPVPPTPVAALRVTPQADSFFVGRSTTGNPFSITLIDANGNTISNGAKVTYASSAPTVFTVDAATGVVTGKTVGTGLFRASASGKFVEAGVKIIAPVDRIQLNSNDFTLTIGSTRQLAPNLAASDGASISGRVITFSSSAPAVATISSAGLVTAIAEGTATLTAAVEGKSASLTVTVIKEPVLGITLSPPVAQLLRIGGQLPVVATPRGATGQPLTGRTVTWFTNNPQVATVSPSGVITAVGVGNATITAECETRTATLGVTVTEVPPRSVTLEPDTFQLSSGLTRQLTPTVIDSAGRQVTNYTNRQVIWQSTSSLVAAVGTTGIVTGVGAGAARISVTVDGLRSNDVVAVVSPQVASVRVTPAVPQVLRIGSSVQLAAQALDNNNQPIAGKVATWLSSNPTIASVSSTGRVTGVAVGTTTITADIDNRTASVTVSVTLVPVGTVTFTPAIDTMAEADQRQFNPVVKDTAGRVIASLIGRSVIFNSNNVPVATVSNQGVVVGVLQGSATITASVDGVISNDLALRVAKIATVTLAPASATIAVGATQALAVTLLDGAGNTIQSSRTVIFTTSAPGVATVNPAGVVTGVSAGTATISAIINGVLGSATITVQ